MAKSYHNAKYLLAKNAKFLIRFSGGVAVVSFIFYTYFLGHTIYSVIDRKAIEHSNETLSSEVSMLELNYLKQVQSIDRPFALAHGFSEPAHTYYSNENILLSFRSNVR